MGNAMRRVILLASSSVAALLAGTKLAFAEPVSLSIAAVSAFLATPVITTAAGATALTIGGALSIAFTIGSIGLQLGLQATQKKPRLNPTDAKSTFESSEAPEINAIGRVRLGGLKIFGNTSMSDRYRLVAHCKGELAAIEAYFLGGREVTVNSDGAVSSPPYARPGGDSYVFVLSKVGDGTEVTWGTLQVTFPTIWTVNHRVRGIAQSLIRYINPGLTSPKFQKMYQGGPPDLEIIARVQKPFDPRTNSYAWSENGIINALFLATQWPELTLDDFDLDFIADEADRADAIVNTLTATEKRARAWGVWSSETPRADSFGAILRSIGAEIVHNPDNNKLRIRLIDDNREPELEFPLKHILRVQWRSGPESVERPNFCRVKYYSPERNYELAEVNLPDSEWAREDDEISRVGLQPVDYEYPFCPSASQAQRIARREFLFARGDSGVIVTNLAGRALWGLRTVAFEFPTIGWQVCEIGPPRIDALSGEVQVPFVVHPDMPEWNPAEHESPAPAVIPEIVIETGVPQPAAPTAACVVTYPSSIVETRIAYADAGPSITVESVYRTYTGGLPNLWQPMDEYRAPGGNSISFILASLEGQNIDTRIAHFNVDEDGSLWSPTFNVTPAAINTAPDAPGFTKIERPDDREVDFTITAPTNLHVAYIVFTWGGDVPSAGSETVACRPGQVFLRTRPTNVPVLSNQTATFTAQAFSSNGTASSLVTLNVFIPAESPP